ncbi:MAG: hypothetical protein MUC85_03535 [Anaerolineales bacterium]|jgi:hypothetical protein|nr:hypothetical protein [Anaerolineales bacterium]
MFEEFRQQAEESEYEQNASKDTPTGDEISSDQPVPIRLSRPKRVLGMTAPQRFVIVLMLFLEVILLGSMFLLVTQRVIPPIFY